MLEHHYDSVAVDGRGADRVLRADGGANECGKRDNNILSCHQLLYQGFAAYVSLDRLETVVTAGFRKLGAATCKCINDSYLMPCGKQCGNQYRTDISCAAGNENSVLTHKASHLLLNRIN